MLVGHFYVLHNTASKGRSSDWYNVEIVGASLDDDEERRTGAKRLGGSNERAVSQLMDMLSLSVVGCAIISSKKFPTFILIVGTTETFLLPFLITVETKFFL